MEFIKRHDLIQLKRILGEMIEQDRITHNEASDILSKAGLSDLPNEDASIDETSAKYYFN